MTAPVLVGPSPAGGGPVPSLSERHLGLLRRQAAGEKCHEIAPSMFMTPSGVSALSQRIIARLGARSLAHAVHIAHGLGLLDPPPAVRLPLAIVQVLELVADGRTNEEIARLLGRSKHTVASQVRDARRRLGARDRAHAAVLAIEARLIRHPIRTS